MELQHGLKFVETILGLEALGKGYTVNQDWLPLVPGLGPFVDDYNAS